MENVLAPVDFTMEDLLRNTLSTTLIKERAAYAFDFSQRDRVLCPKRLDAYRLPMIISPPNVREPGENVVQRFIVQFYVGKDSRFKEEGVGVESEPQAERGRS